jgi:hypothetical protein
MTQHKEMHPLIVCVSYRWVHFLLEVVIRFYFKRVSYSARASILDIALFKYEGCILLHVLISPILLSLFVDYYIKLLHWLYLLPVHFHMHLYDIPRLLSHYVIELPGKIL